MEICRRCCTWCRCSCSRITPQWRGGRMLTSRGIWRRASRLSDRYKARLEVFARLNCLKRGAVGFLALTAYCNRALRGSDCVLIAVQFVQDLGQVVPGVRRVGMVLRRP